MPDKEKITKFFQRKERPSEVVETAVGSKSEEICILCDEDKVRSKYFEFCEDCYQNIREILLVRYEDITEEVLEEQMEEEKKNSKGKGKGKGKEKDK